MKIISQRAIRGPNYYDSQKGIIMQVEGAREAQDLTRLVDLAINLQEEVRGFIQAPESQVVDPSKGLIFYSYLNESLGMRAGQLALEIINKDAIDFQPYFAELDELYESERRASDVQAAIELAEGLGVPWYEFDDVIQLGQGKYAYRIKSGSVDLDLISQRLTQKLIRGIPVIAVTGTNGKTTTSRLINHVLEIAGYKVGMTSTDGVHINGKLFKPGDFSGPLGAKEVFRHLQVDMAVLEVARGGILRRGLGYDESDVAIMTNVSSDHLGIGGVETLEELARVKGTIVTAVKVEGHGVLNADDTLVLKTKAMNPGHTILFSAYFDNPAFQDNQGSQDYNIYLKDQEIWIDHQSVATYLGNVKDMPITFGGRADFNIMNVMASVGGLIAIGIDLDMIRTGLRTFTSDFNSTPGRMNIIDVKDFKVVIDYGHNPAAVSGTGDFFRDLMPGRKIRMTSAAGDRRDEDIIELGYQVAHYFDGAILTDPTPRGRALGESVDLIYQGLRQGGMAEQEIFKEFDESKAIDLALKMAQPGDLLVLQVEHIQAAYQQVMDYKKDQESPGNIGLE